MGLAAVAAAEGQGVRAARLFGAATAAMDALGLQVWAPNQFAGERAVARAQALLSPRVFAAAWAEGMAQGLDEVMRQELERQPDDTSRTPPGSRAARLTERERAVARLAAHGLSNRGVATALVISERTAANHLQRVLDKLELRSRAQLAARRVEFGLASKEPVT